MNNVTTPETSQRLKAAGFPQPVPEFGQVWYNAKKHIIICVKNETEYGDSGVSFFNTGTGVTFSLPVKFFETVKQYDVYAPTATDILRELPNIVYRRYGKAHWQLGELTLPEKGPHIVDFQRSHDENDAEMLAKKWLSLHEKHNEK